MFATSIPRYSYRRMEKKSIQYQDILIHELQQRTRRNSAYSMTAYARDLNISVSSLSRVIAGAQGLSLSKAEKIAEKLELNPEESKVFCTMVEKQHARSKAQRELAEKSLSEMSLDISHILLRAK